MREKGLRCKMYLLNLVWLIWLLRAVVDCPVMAKYVVYSATYLTMYVVYSATWSQLILPAWHGWTA